MSDEPTLEQRMDEWLADAFDVKLATSRFAPKGTAYVIDTSALSFTGFGSGEPRFEIYVQDGEDARVVRRRLARIDGIDS